MRSILVAAFMIVGLAGCVSPVTEQYIQEKNWTGLAYSDVELGHKARTSADLDKLGATTSADQDTYKDAYKEHVKVYCDPKNAYSAGILGKPRNSVCIDDTPTGWLYKENWLQGLEGNAF